MIRLCYSRSSLAAKRLTLHSKSRLQTLSWFSSASNEDFGSSLLQSDSSCQAGFRIPPVDFSEKLNVLKSNVDQKSYEIAMSTLNEEGFIEYMSVSDLERIIDSLHEGKRFDEICHIVELAVLKELPISNKIGRIYFDNFKEEKDGFRNLVSVLTNMTDNNQADSYCFEKCILFCARNGKWRTTTDLMMKMYLSGHPWTPEVLSATVAACSKEQSSQSVIAAFQYFKHMTIHGIYRSPAMYLSMLNGLNRCSLYHRSALVWDYLFADVLKGNIKLFDADGQHDTKHHMVDQLYSAYINLLCGQEKHDQAFDIFLNVVSKSIESPRHSFKALYQGLTRAKRSDDINKLISFMNKLGIELSSNHVSGFIKTLLRAGQYSDVVSYLEDIVQAHQNIEIPDNIWTTTFNSFISQGLGREASQLFTVLESYSRIHTVDG